MPEFSLPENHRLARRSSRRRTATAVLTGLALAAAVTAVPTVASARPSAPAGTADSRVRPAAPVLGTATQGGAVIVWMAHDHAGLDLRTQASKRIREAHVSQRPVIADIRAHGGTDVVRLVSVNAVAAHVSAAEVVRLSHRADVKQIVPDVTFTVGDRGPTGPQESGVSFTKDTVEQHRAGVGSRAYPTNSCGTQANPLVEPEADNDIHAPAMTNAGLATEAGHGVVVSNDGISTAPTGDLVGNPNFVRPAADGGGSVVVGATAGDTTDSTDGEYYGDASSIDAQGTVEYQYANELPFSGLPSTCYFVLVGDAPGASLVDARNVTTPESKSVDPAVMSESQIVAGIDAAVTKYHADVINESYGYSNTPGAYATHYAANDAAVAAGVTVVASSGDSGDSGTVSSPATDPLIIAAGATNTLRLNAMAYGFASWVNDGITPLSSGGTSPNNKLVDLVAPGYGGEAACNPDGSDCPTNTQTEAFGGTSEAAPLIAGAAADVISAFRDSHNGDSPSPAQVKSFLTSTATDISAPADQQGSGLVNIAAAVAAAQQSRNTTATKVSAPSLVASTSQLDLTGAGGSTSAQTVSLYNSDSASTTVSGTYRSLSPETPIGSTVTENVTAPDPSLPVPADGADAAAPVTFTVPSGLDRLDADMIWPDATNGAILNMILVDPEGRLRQISYDYGASPTKAGAIGSVPDIAHVEVAKPEAGTWTAEIKWGNGRSHLQEAPNVPGTYTGTVSFAASGQTFVTTPATAAPVTIASHGTATIPLNVAMPSTPGDHPESVQFVGANGAATSIGVARRTLIPSTGGPFNTLITSSVGRGLGGISSYDVVVPAGQPDLGIQVQTADASTDNPMSIYLVNPSGTAVTHTVNGKSTSAYTLAADAGGQGVTAHVANPAAGTWEVDVKLNLTTSGKEFQQVVYGDVLPQAPVITGPATGSTATATTSTISGTGVLGDTVTVVDGTGAALCTAPVAADGTWSCSAALTAGSDTLTATQADATGDPSLASAPVTVTVPSSTTITLAVDPAAPYAGDEVDLTATTTGVPDGTVVTFLDGTTSLGTGTVASGVATLDLPAGLAAGDHPLSADAAATGTSVAADSTVVDTVVAPAPTSSISLAVDPSAPSYGDPVALTATTTGAPDGAVVTFLDGTSSLGTATVASGTATLSLPSGLSVGGHPLNADLAATETSPAASSSVVETSVAKDASTATLALSRTTVAYGRVVTGVVTVSPAGVGTATVTYSGTTVSVPIGAGGTGSFTLPAALAVGAHTVTASYDGTDTVAASPPVSAHLVVTRASTSTSLAISSAKVKANGFETVSIRVGGRVGGAYPTGVVLVRAKLHGAHTVAKARLVASSDGMATLRIQLPPGTGEAILVAKYKADGDYTASTSAARSVKVG